VIPYYDHHMTVCKQWHSNVKYSIMFIHCITSLHLQYKRCNVSATML
jgi:hypothetical protein